MKKYYILRAAIWIALSNEQIYDGILDVPDSVWKKISIVYKEAEFTDAFNGNEVDSGGDYLRVL